MDDDIVRIVVSTDNHLGFAERDPIRCDDSFAAFEEVLQTARAKKADFLLFAGDMFHENKPSRRTMHSAMELLRTYSLGPEPVFTEILNDQSELFKSNNGRVNYEDPYQSVSLPIFAIHGNHDDASREGGMGDSLAALDLLAVSNLINYFGKADRVDEIEITPILLRKGNTHVAIYGLGAVRDERLNRMWNQKRVKFVRLTEEQGRDNFFNIFLLHQNRDSGRGSKNCIHESMIPEWMDLVIWGNEHESQPQLMDSLVGTYRILQPGSSVATSLGASESSLHPKHSFFFEIKEKKFRVKPTPLRQVRQFIYSDLSLKDFTYLDANDPQIEENIKTILANKVNEMIAEGRDLVEEQLQSAGSAVVNKYNVKEPLKVLVRLRVDHEGFPAINHQRFGAQFVKEVANPLDVVLLAKKRREVMHRAVEGGGAAAEALLAASRNGRNNRASGRDLEGAEEDELSKIKIDDLVSETLQASRNSLSLLVESEMSVALENYIVRKDPNAIFDFVSESLLKTQKLLNKETNVEDHASVIKAATRLKAEAEEKAMRDQNRRAGSSSSSSSSKVQLDDITRAGVGSSSSSSNARGSRTTNGDSDVDEDGGEEEEDDDDNDDEAGKDDDGAILLDDSNDDDDDDIHAQSHGNKANKKSKGKSRSTTSVAKSKGIPSSAAAKKNIVASAASSNKKGAVGASRRKVEAPTASRTRKSKEEEEEEADEQVDSGTTNVRRSNRSAAKSIKSYFSAAPVDSEDEEEEEEEENGAFRASDEDDLIGENSVSEAEFDDEDEEEEEEEYKAPRRGKRGAVAGAGVAKKRAVMGAKSKANAPLVATGSSARQQPEAAAIMSAGRSIGKAIDSSIEGIDDDSAEESDMPSDFTGRSSVPTQQSIRLPAAAAAAASGIDIMTGGQKRGPPSAGESVFRVGKSQQGARKGRSTHKTDWDN